MPVHRKGNYLKRICAKPITNMYNYDLRTCVPVLPFRLFDYCCRPLLNRAVMQLPELLLNKLVSVEHYRDGV